MTTESFLITQSEFCLIHKADFFSFNVSRFPAGKLDHTATWENFILILLRSFIPKLSVSYEHDYAQKKLIQLKRTFCYLKCTVAHTHRHTTDVDMAKCRHEILLSSDLFKFQLVPDGENLFFKHQLGPSDDARNLETLISTRCWG